MKTARHIVTQSEFGRGEPTVDVDRFLDSSYPTRHTRYEKGEPLRVGEKRGGQWWPVSGEVPAGEQPLDGDSGTEYHVFFTSLLLPKYPCLSSGLRALIVVKGHRPGVFSCYARSGLSRAVSIVT
ncbi:MAG TPA: hypothetical protein VFX60_13175 [Micromonospora sp.]|nr:hypothetical protein [Micromonospora sp.]